MVARLQQKVREEDVEDRVVLAGIDTKDDELDRFLGPDGADIPRRQRLQLRHPEDGGRQITQERSYLYDDADLAPEGGATKERPIARYYLDSKNFERVRELIEIWTDKLDRQTGNPENINVWIMNALGGGTGSGTFPLVSLTLHDQLKNEYGVRIRGVGTLPKANINGQPDFSSEPPEEVIEVKQPGDSRHYLNTYLALRELQGLIDVDEEVTIPLESEPDNLQKLEPELSFNRSPFDRYFLQRIDDGKESEQYYREMNETVANLIYFYGQVQEAEDFPEDVQDTRDSILCAVDGCGAEFPRARTSRYLDLKTQSEVMEKKQRAVERQKETLQDDLSFLTDALSVPKGQQPDDDSSVPDFLIDQCRNHPDVGVEEFNLTNFSEGTLEDRLSTAAELLINDKFESLRQKFELRYFQGDELGKDQFDEIFGEEGSTSLQRIDGFSVNSVVKYFYLDQFLARLEGESTQAQQDLERKIEDLWNERSDEISKHEPDLYKRVRDANLKRKYEALTTFYTKRIDELREEIENSFFSGSEEQKKENYNSELQTLRKKKSIYDTRQEQKNIVAQERQILKNEELQQRRNDLEDGIEELGDLKEGYSKDQEDLQTRRQRLEEQLQQPEIERYAEWPVQSPDILTDELRMRIDENDVDFSTLERKNIIDAKEGCAEFLKELCLNRNGPEELDRIDDDAEPYSILCAQYHPSATGDTVNWDDLLGYVQSQATINDYPEDRAVKIHDRLTIDLVVMYTNIQVQNLTEYAFIHDQYTNPELSVGSVLTGEPTEELENHMHFAYRELVDRDVSKQQQSGAD
jgi:hypothetical protein